MITGILIDDVLIDPREISAEIVILHGRKKVTDGPTASSATVIVESSVMPTWGEGNKIVLMGDTGLAFTGRITDRVLEHNYPSIGTFTLTAMGTVAVLGYRNVGDIPWPQESGASRAEHILQAANVQYLIDGAADALVLPRDADSNTAMSLLDELVKSTGAAVVDYPDGSVVYQPMRERARPVHPYRWEDFTGTEIWSDFPSTFTWADFVAYYSSDSEFTVDIPGSVVDWEPSWETSESDIINHVRVGYGTNAGGGEQPFTELQNPLSIENHEKRYKYFGTILAELAGAQEYASWILNTRAASHWQMQNAKVYLEYLDDALRAKVLNLSCGDRVRIDGFPSPTPAIVAEAIVEGWTYNMWGENGNLYETIVLYTSSLLDSLSVPMWNEYPFAFEWQQHNPALEWSDIVAVPAG